MTNKYGLMILTIGLIAIVLVVTQIAASTQSPINLNNEVKNATINLNNGIKNALIKCGINNAYVETETPKVIGESVVVGLNLSNHYEIQLTINLTNNELPISNVNITIKTSNGKICNSTRVPISSSTGNYNYTTFRTNYFLVIVSYTGVTPTVVNSSRSLTIYGTAIGSAIVIPMIQSTNNIVSRIITEYVTCTTGTLTPVYMVNVLNKPIIYMIQLGSSSNELLCRYNQDISYVLMTVLIGVAAALISEAVIILIRVSRLGIT